MKVEWLERSLITGLPYCLCLQEKQFHSILKKYKIPKSKWPPFISSKQANATVHFLVNPSTGSEIHIVCLGDFSGQKTVQIYALLIHEAVHIWQAFREYIGEKSPSSEFEAYAIQQISQSLMMSFDKQRAALKKVKK